MTDPMTQHVALSAPRKQELIDAYQRGELTAPQWAELVTLIPGLLAQWERRNGR